MWEKVRENQYGLNGRREFVDWSVACLWDYHAQCFLKATN